MGADAVTLPGWQGGRAVAGAARALGFAFVVGACSKGLSVTADPPDAASPLRSSFLDVEIAKAEDLRRANDLPLEAQTSRDPVVRRRAARAVARILGDEDGALIRALEDEDGETVAWGAYGLGESCAGRQESHVRALAARLASLRRGRTSATPNPVAAILRALGRCGSDEGEMTLRAWLGRGGNQDGSRRDLDEDAAAAFALGDIADQRGALAVESIVALIAAAEHAPPLDAALYALGRPDVPSKGDLEARVIAAARAALGRPGPSRIFALRSIGRAAEGARSLAQVLSSNDFTPAERAEAARELGRLGDAGQSALAAAISSLLGGTHSPLQGDRFGVVLAAVDALREDPPTSADGALWVLARLEAPPARDAAAARRASALRCAAAERLARGAWESGPLVACDVGDGEAGERARLAALDRGRLVKARQAAWLDLFRRSDHVRVGESAVEAIGRHPELEEAGRRVLAEALRTGKPGMVAAAAKVVAARPQRFSDPLVESALAAATEHGWTEDQVETRASLVEAALAAGGERGRAFAEAACADVNQAVRARAARALAAAGAGSRCAGPDSSKPPASEIGHTLGRPTRVTFDTDAGLLGVRFDPGLAPIAATRFVALARSGFYTGITVHRVVPGLVVQFGDREGDGYGGSGRLLRCETSPVPFAPLDVGVALSGRDTGSSQIFVVLARHPPLDGQYAWVGRADGDWNAVAEGDIVHAVHVEE